MNSQSFQKPACVFKRVTPGRHSFLSRLSIALAVLLTLAVPSQTSFAQHKSAAVTGVVIDAATSQPLVGVTCIVEGTHKGTTTGIDGTFSINLAPGHKVITFTCLGYETRKVNWAGETEMKIQLVETAHSVDEVVVVGYGTQKKSDITGAVGSVSKDRIEKMVSTDIAQIMQGAIPGLNIMATAAGANPEGQSGLMLIRGRNSISASNEPLIVLDGSPYYGSISDINTSDIASIEVLKDASSAAIYGSRGSNGVILINTRQGTEGKVTIRYDGYYAIQTVANFPHIMNGDEYFNHKRNWNDDDDSDPDASLNETERSVYADGSWRDWTWKELLTRTGYSTRHNVSASGGTKTVKYNVSLNYLRNKGTIINDQYQRAQFRANLSVNLAKWLSYSTNTMFTWSDNSGATPKFVDVFNKSPLLRPFNADGSINITPDLTNEKRFNPLECLLYDDYNASYKLATNTRLRPNWPRGSVTHSISASSTTTRSTTNTRAPIRAPGKAITAGANSPTKRNSPIRSKISSTTNASSVATDFSLLSSTRSKRTPAARTSSKEPTFPTTCSPTTDSHRPSNLPPISTKPTRNSSRRCSAPTTNTTAAICSPSRCAATATRVSEPTTSGAYSRRSPSAGTSPTRLSSRRRAR